MKKPSFNTTVLFYPKKNPKLRLFALWYFTILMVAWNILGHTYLGFEQSWAAPFVGVGSAIFIQLFLEWVDARVKNRELRWGGGLSNFLNSLPAALIPGFACAMLLYTNVRLWPIIFAVALSIGSKVLIRAPVGQGRTQHIFNPSNFGVAVTLLLFPQIGFAPPYHFTENITGVWDWILPGVILLSGVVIHGWFTGRLPLVAAWLIGFALQGQIRAYLFNTPALVPFMPMTSAAFIVFTLYMVPDPATTPLNPWRQVAFGFSVAVVYGVIQVLHLVFGLFFALVAVCAIRGLSLWIYHSFKSKQPAAAESPARETAVPQLVPQA
ncbi:MAG TPA: enediyne biosynthesis protein UnbU [Candidatus Dormibacteraeota bacterium]|nr:enediyne biosynthesis protein UnbU [Candidatus Dormibacteraeota bacterium]